MPSSMKYNAPMPILRHATLMTFSLFAAISVLLLPSVADAQTGTAQLDYAGLKSMVKNMGYEPKDLDKTPGKEVAEFTVKGPKLTLYITTEVSSSKSYVWLTVSFGKTSEIKNFSARLENLLKENAMIQPGQFFISKGGYLKYALPLENRGIDAALLRKRIDKVVEDVEDTAGVWGDVEGGR